MYYHRDGIYPEEARKTDHNFELQTFTVSSIINCDVCHKLFKGTLYQVLYYIAFLLGHLIIVYQCILIGIQVHQVQLISAQAMRRY